jgi:hypothetical protein
VRFFILLVGLGFTVLCHAQEITGNVAGRIKSVSGEALVGASIAAYQNSETPVAGVAADDAGKFSLQLAPGRYKLVVSFTGYQSRESELLVIAGKTTTLSVTLQEVPTELEEIVSKPGASKWNRFNFNFHRENVTGSRKLFRSGAHAYFIPRCGGCQRSG